MTYARGYLKNINSCQAEPVEAFFVLSKAQSTKPVLRIVEVRSVTVQHYETAFTYIIALQGIYFRKSEIPEEDGWGKD